MGVVHDSLPYVVSQVLEDLQVRDGLVPQESDLQLLQQQLNHLFAAVFVSPCADQCLEPPCVSLFDVQTFQENKS
jgi:hypothetical protein